MIIAEILAIALLVPTAALSYRKAPTISLTLIVAFIANVAYANDIVQAESIRWVSALVGIVGAVEFGRGVERMLERNPVSIPDALRLVDGATWIGLIVLASMTVDGFGMLVFRWFDVWIVPEATIGILISVCLLGIFGKERTNS